MNYMPLDFSYQIDVYSKPTPPPPPPANRKASVVQPPARRGARQPVVIPDPRRQGGGGGGRRPVLPLPQDQTSITPFDGKGGDDGSDGFFGDIWNEPALPATHVLPENKRRFVGNLVGDLDFVTKICMGVYGTQLRPRESSTDGGGERAGPGRPSTDGGGGIEPGKADGAVPARVDTRMIVIDQKMIDQIKRDISLWSGILSPLNSDCDIGNWVDDLKRLHANHEVTERIKGHLVFMVTRVFVICQLMQAFHETIKSKIGAVTGDPSEQTTMSTVLQICSSLEKTNLPVTSMREFRISQWHEMYSRCYSVLDNVSKTVGHLVSRATVIQKYTKLTDVSTGLLKIQGYAKNLAPYLANELVVTTGEKLKPLDALLGPDEFSQFHARISALLHDIVARWDRGPAADEGPEEPPLPPDDDSGGGGWDGRGGGGGGGKGDMFVPGRGGGDPGGDGEGPARREPPPVDRVAPEAAGREPDGGDERPARREYPPPPAGEDGRDEGRRQEEGEEGRPFPGHGERRREFGEGGGGGWEWEEEGPAAGGGGRERPAVDESRPEDLARRIADMKRYEAGCLQRIARYKQDSDRNPENKLRYDELIDTEQGQLRQILADISNLRDEMKSDGKDDREIGLAIEDSRLDMEIRESEEDVTRFMARIMEMRENITEDNRRDMDRSIKEVQDSLDSVQVRIHDLKMEHSQVHAAMIADITAQIDDLPDFLKGILEDPEAAGTSDRQVAANVRKLVREDPGLDAGALLAIIRVLSDGTRDGGSQAHRRLRAMKERLEAMRSSPGLYKAWLKASLADRQQAT